MRNIKTVHTQLTTYVFFISYSRKLRFVSGLVVNWWPVKMTETLFSTSRPIISEPENQENGEFYEVVQEHRERVGRVMGAVISTGLG